MGQEFKQAQLHSTRIHVVSLGWHPGGVVGSKMACSLPGLMPHKEQLEAAPSLSVVSGPSTWLLQQSRPISYVVPQEWVSKSQGFQRQLRAGLSALLPYPMDQRRQGAIQTPGEGTQTPIRSGKSVKQPVGIVPLPQWLWESELLIHKKHWEQSQHEANTHLLLVLASLVAQQ